MKQLTRYQPSKKHREFVKQSGFDLDFPNKRFPVQNLVIERLLKSAKQVRDHRRHELLKERQSREHDLVRSITWACGLLFGGLTTQDAYAASSDFNGIYLIPVFDRVSEWIDLVLDAMQANPADAWLVGISVVSTAMLFRLVSLQNRLSLNKDSAQPLEAEDMTTKNEKADSKIQTNSACNPFVWRTSCATRTGKMRSENQDRFRVLNQSPNEIIQVACDGAGGHKGGAEAAELAVNTIADHLLDEANCENPVQAIKQAIAEAQQVAIEANIEGITTAIIAWYRDDWLYFATLGDGNVAVIWPDGMVSQHLTPHHTIDEPKNRIAGFIGGGCKTPPRFGSIRLETGCQVLVMSDGAGDLFPYEDYARHREKYRLLLEKPQSDIAAKLLKQFEDARHPESGAYFHRDNMTLLMASPHSNAVDGEAT